MLQCTAHMTEVKLGRIVDLNLLRSEINIEQVSAGSLIISHI